MAGITLLGGTDMARVGRPRKRLSAADSAVAEDSASAEGARGGGSNNNGLCNAQPFRPNRPYAAIPVAPGGCARASSFVAERISHGTGSGCTSTAGSSAQAGGPL